MPLSTPGFPCCLWCALVCTGSVPGKPSPPKPPSCEKGWFPPHTRSPKTPGGGWHHSCWQPAPGCTFWPRPLSKKRRQPHIFLGVPLVIRHTSRCAPLTSPTTLQRTPLHHRPPRHMEHPHSAGAVVGTPSPMRPRVGSGAAAGPSHQSPTRTPATATVLGVAAPGGGAWTGVRSPTKVAPLSPKTPANILQLK